MGYTLYVNPWLQRAYDHGIEDGEKRGKADGIKEGAKNIAGQLITLGSTLMEDISKATGLTITELKNLHKEIGS